MTARGAWGDDELLPVRPTLQIDNAFVEVVLDRYPGLTEGQASGIVQDLQGEVLEALKLGNEIAIAEPLGNGQFDVDVLTMEQHLGRSLRRRREQ